MLVVGLVAGLLGTYALLDYVLALPWEPALAREDFERHLLMRAASPDGKWIASIVREPAIDDKWNCLACLERGGTPGSRECFGESFSIEEPRLYELKWSADSLKVSLQGGSKVIWKYDVRDAEWRIAQRHSR